MFLDFSRLTLDPDALRHDLRDFMSPQRALHTLGAESRAVTLAMRWNQDVRKARVAALLHDITKECKNQLKLLGYYGILLPEREAAPLEVWHAITGAAVARALSAGEDICAAIRWHTTGRAGMTTLDKLIYLADETEPGRGQAGELWRLCLTDLDRALYMRLTRAIASLQSRARAIDPHSVQALAWVAERLRYNEQRTTC